MKADSARAAQLGYLRRIIEGAIFENEVVLKDHKKFEKMSYYKADVEYNGDIFRLWLNVGKAKNDGVYHVYAITKRTRDVLNNTSSRAGAYAIQPSSSINSIE